MISVAGLKRVLWPVALALCAVATHSVAAPPIYYGNSGAPYSEAVQVGDMLYLSGQIGTVPGTTKPVPGGMTAEARQTMDNVGAILARRGLGFDDLVKCTVMLVDMSEWAAFNAIYVGYFKPGRLPARSAFGATGLAYGGRIELECWAYSRVKKAKR